MKKLRILGLAFLILILIIGVFQVSQAFISRWQLDASPASARALSPLETPVVGLPNGQRNILLVSADDLSSRHPRLETVFLVLITPGNTNLSFLPVYPSLSEKFTRQDKQLADAFRLAKNDGSLQLAADFFNHLSQRDIWWSAYIVLDRTALAHLLDSLEEAGLDTNGLPGSVPTGQLIVDGLPPIGENPSLTVNKQVEILKEMCWRTARIDTDNALIFLKSFPVRLAGRYFNDLTNNPALVEFNHYSLPTRGYACDFPTLSAQANLKK